MKDTKSIMVVEDKEQMSTYLRLALRAFGYEIAHITNNGEEAVRKAARLKPDLIMMDIFIEGSIDGIEAARQIKETLDIPVVFLSGHMDDQSLERAKMCEPYGYLLKPFKKLELKTTIEMALYKHRAEMGMKGSHYWLDTTFEGINEAVIATDAKGVIERMNARAENLTGWSKEDAVGTPASEVFRIRDKERGASVDDPVSKVISENATIEFTNNVYLESKDENKQLIHYSARTHKDKQGNMCGVLLVFKSADDTGEDSLSDYSEDIVHDVLIPATDLSSAPEGEESGDSERISELQSELEELRNLKKALDEEILKCKITEQTQLKAHEEIESRLGEKESQLSKANEAFHAEKSLNEKLRSEVADYKDLMETVNNLDSVTVEDTYHDSINKLSKALSRALSVEEIAQNTANILHSYLVNTDYISVYMVENGSAVLQAHSGMPEDLMKKVSILKEPEGYLWNAVNDMNSVSGTAGEENQDSGDETDTNLNETGVINYLSVPITSDDIVIGCINLESIQPGSAFSGNDIQFVEQTARYAGIAISNLVKKDALEDSLRLYTELLRNSNEGVFLFDETCRIIESNSRFTELLNARNNELNLIKGDDTGVGRLVSEMKSLGPGEIKQVDFTHIVKDDIPAELSATLISIRDEDGSLRQGMGIIGPADQDLTADNSLLNTALNSIDDALLILDEDGIVVTMNEAAGFISSCSQDEAAGKPFEEVIQLTDKVSGAKPDITYHSSSANGNAHAAESDMMLFNKHGEEKILSLALTRVRNRKPDIRRTIVRLKDVSGNRILEDMALKSYELESVCGLAAGVAHDFNNILTGIIGHISLAKIYLESEEEIYGWLVESERACFEAAELARRFMFFADTDPDAEKLVMDIGKLITSSVGLATKGRNVKCDFKINDNLRPALVDEKRISRMVYNIALNAQQAMPGGGIIRVTAENINKKESLKLDFNKARDEYIKITIEDHGRGIPPEHMSQIFEPHYTLSESKNGLGLSTSLNIVKSHNGHIEIESDTKIGTKVHIYLPVEATEAELPKAEELHIENATDLSPTESKTNGHVHMRVLLMDDDGNIRITTGKSLINLGFDVEFASDGEEAIEKYHAAIADRVPFDAVILDLTVAGGMGAEDTIGELLKIDPDTRVVLSSGHYEDPVIQNHKEYGFRDFISKPYQMTDLTEVIKRAVE